METRIININDKEYPERLRKIKNPPENLYVRGNLPDFNKKVVAIIGARNCSDYGYQLANTIAKKLSRNDVQVISGLAMGIDTSANIGAIEVDKPSFAVMGCGADICFPSHNANVYEKIVGSGGGIISELEDGQPPLPQNFPLRDRIISGLADVVIVVEARKISGSLITVDYAIEQGKAVFACAGRVGDSLSEGTLNLIKQGAYILTDPNDVLEYLNIFVEKEKNKGDHNVNYNELNYFEKLIVDVIEKNENNSVNINAIVNITKLPYSKVENTIMSLKLNDYLNESIPHYYCLSNNYYNERFNVSSVDKIKDKLKENNFEGTGMSEKDIKNLSRDDMKKLGV